MHHKKHPRDFIPFGIVTYIMTLYLALKLAPYSYGALFYNIMQHGNEVFDKPLKITLCSNTPKVVLVCSFIWFLAFLLFVSSLKYKRPGEEHGSADWADIRYICKKFSSGQPDDRIFTANVSMSYDSYMHPRNLLTVLVGGPGTGKTRGYVIPNILQNGKNSLLISDPKSEILKATGRFLISQGYEVRVLDLIDMSKSFSYNPLKYVKTENDIEKLVNIIMTSTKVPGERVDDQFWENSAKMELYAYFSYLKAMAPEEEQNFATMIELFRNDGVDEEDDKYVSPTSMLFNRLKLINPNHEAVAKYEFYHSGAAKTIKSIQAVLISRLSAFSLKELQQMTMNDELDLPSLGTKKVALFTVISDSDTTFSFLVSILYMQLIQQLYYLADHVYEGRLPVHVHMIMDEFANVQLPPEFDKNLATMRSRNISVSIIIQSLFQIKSLFQNNWGSILEDCDEFLYLGGNENETFEYISKRLGKSTVYVDSTSKTLGVKGSSSQSVQSIERELMKPDEVGKMDRGDCILFINGEKPVYDKKYDVLKHPNAKFTPLLGNNKLVYRHGTVRHVSGSFKAVYGEKYEKEAKTYIPSERFLAEFGIYSPEEMERIYNV